MIQEEVNSSHIHHNMDQEEADNNSCLDMVKVDAILHPNDLLSFHDLDNESLHYLHY